MKGLQEFYDGDFEQWMQEQDSESLKDEIDSSMRSYHTLFGEAFFCIGKPMPTYENDEALNRWVNWCIFYGRPKDEYPGAKYLS